MSLTTMSLKEAEKIVNLFAHVIIKNERLPIYKKIRYSELNGYTIFDVDNALKLTSAYRVFNSPVFDDHNLEKLKKEASLDGVAIMSFNLFAPDNIVQQINKLDYNNENDKFRILALDRNHIFSYTSFDAETHSSFLNFCLSIEKTDKNYWEKIYDRLGITWDERDEYDEIFYIIQNKDIFFKASQVKNEQQIEESEKLIIEEKNSSSSFYVRNKNILDNVILSIILICGIYFTPIRIFVFGALALTGLVTIYVLRKELLENKLDFLIKVVYIIAYLIGILFGKAGFYVSILAIIWIIVGILKEVLSSKQKSLQ